MAQALLQRGECAAHHRADRGAGREDELQHHGAAVIQYAGQGNLCSLLIHQGYGGRLIGGELTGVSFPRGLPRVVFMTRFAPRLSVRCERQKQRHEMFAGQDMQTLIAALNPEKLLELNLQHIQANKTPQEILAMAAADNPDVAKAIYEMEQARSQMNIEQKEESRKVYQEASDRFDRIVTETVNAMAKSTKQSDVSINPDFLRRN